MDLLKNDRCEYDYAEAHKFAKKWYQNKLHEAKKIWHARNHLVHQDDTLVPWPTLNAQFRDALQSMQALGNKLPHVDKIRKRNRHYMERYIERARPPPLPTKSPDTNLIRNAESEMEFLT